jgi:hypothetical protein
MAGFRSEHRMKEHVMNTQSHHSTMAKKWPSHALFFRPTEARRTQALLLTAALLAASVVACAPIDQGGPRDVGNMAYPAPLPQGNLGTVTLLSRQPRDTGNMAYPDALPQGNVGTTALSGRQPRDTGNMAYPAPSPVGNIATTTVR